MAKQTRRTNGFIARSYVEVHEELMVKSVELLPDTSAHDAHLAIFSIVLDAILKNEVHIVQEILELQVLIRIQLLFDCAKIHRLLNDF
jgi:hypothetical protein